MLVFVYVSIALQIVNALTIIQTQVDRHLRPRIVRLVQDQNSEGLGELSKQYGLLYLLPLLAGCVILALFSDEVIGFVFGEKWLPTASYLRYLLPLIISAATLRYLDIVVVATGAGTANLVINVGLVGILLTVLFLMPDSRDVYAYLVTIVAVQFIHVAILGAYLYRSRSFSRKVMPV